MIFMVIVRSDNFEKYAYKYTCRLSAVVTFYTQYKYVYKYESYFLHIYMIYTI